MARPERNPPTTATIPPNSESTNMKRARQTDLEFVATRVTKDISNFQAGASLVARTGYSISEVLAKVAIDRVKLSQQFYVQANSLLTQDHPPYRLVVARSYYSMYHVIRAIVFYTTEGDDFEKHSELPKHIPSDFPQASHWANELKMARLNRNKADYNPYPRAESHFASDATHTVATSKILLKIGKSYLRAKGVSL
jgi:uncharacterized protein (UPF0332 family)